MKMRRVDCQFCEDNIAANWIEHHVYTKHPTQYQEWLSDQFAEDASDHNKNVVATMNNKTLLWETIETAGHIAENDDVTNEDLRRFHLLQRELRHRLADWLNK